MRTGPRGGSPGPKGPPLTPCHTLQKLSSQVHSFRPSPEGLAPSDMRDVLSTRDAHAQESRALRQMRFTPAKGRSHVTHHAEHSGGVMQGVPLRNARMTSLSNGYADHTLQGVPRHGVDPSAKRCINITC